MPELPEAEAVARLVGDAVAGAEVQSAAAPGINAMKTFKPPLDELAGARVKGIRRRGKLLLVDFSSGLSLLIHLMAAGRLQLFDRRAGPRDRTSRVLLRLEDGRELRLREFGTKQRAWAKLLATGEVEADDALARLGPDAWPDPVPAELVTTTDRPLYSLLRDQQTIAGIGRTWADEILWTARLSPFKRASDLDDEEARSLIEAIGERLGFGVAFYLDSLELPLPDRMPKPLQVHGREGGTARVAERRSTRSITATTCSATARKSRPGARC